MPNSKTPSERKYTIARPEAYAAFDVSAVAQAKQPLTELQLPTIGKRITSDLEYPQEKVFGERQDEPVGIVGEVESAEAEPVEKRAVWIVHGMGQQIPFETQDSLAEGIMSVTHPPPGPDGFKPRVRAVKIGDSIVERVELDVYEKGRKLELHLYEAYWAPITEGEVKLADVISFLFDGSFRGLWNSFKNFKFERAMFGKMVPFQVHKRTPLEIWVALTTVVALIVLNAVVVAAGATKFGLVGSRLPALAENWVALTAAASSLSAVALAFGVVLFVAELSKPASLAGWGKGLVRLLTWIAFGLTLATIIFGAVYVGALWVSSKVLALPEIRAPRLQAVATLTVLSAGLLAAVGSSLRGIKRSAGKDLRELGFFLVFFVLSFGVFLAAVVGPFLPYGVTSAIAVPNGLRNFLENPQWVWPFLLLLSYEVRKFLIQYVGDVAAYITPNKLDRFSEIRRKIKNVAATSANAVYLARDGDKFLYDKVAVVGHSLGSVIAYDTLNALLNLDGLTGNQLRVAERTCVLETFASPLDKIAFFFTIQGSDSFHVREQLAAVVQPLISSYPKYRKFPWINVYSHSDIISGPVDFYDDPNTRGVNKVQHIIDDDAIVPLAAHVDYWKNKEVWQRLCAELAR